MPTNCSDAADVATLPDCTPLWAVVGPTASGKSSLCMALAERTCLEIVACDSVQVYKGFDIGSAKASDLEQARVPHHLIDVVAPTAPFDAQMYCDLVDRACAKAQARQARPILCGGTGMYVRAWRYGLAPTVSAHASFRAERMGEEAQRPGALFEALLEVDPQSAQAIGPHNLVQILRALEITVLGGEPASVVRARHKHASKSRPMVLITPMWPDAVLRARIAARIDAMLAEGFVAEVARLLGAGVPGDCRPMQAVGYREVCQHLAGTLTSDALPGAIAKSSWAYARRQRTWLRKEAGVMPLPMQGDAADVDRAWALLNRAS